MSKIPKKPNEKKDPQFEGVVRHFLSTPHTPHAPKKKRAAKKAIRKKVKS